jgi:hypothetical protein
VQTVGLTAGAVHLADRTLSNGIQPLGCLQGGEPVTPASARGSANASPDVASAEPATVQGPYTPNPSLRIDPALGIVIIEFHDDPGKVSSTIPTTRQLAAYTYALGRTAETTTPSATGTVRGTEPGRPGPAMTKATLAASGAPAPDVPPRTAAPLIV